MQRRHEDIHGKRNNASSFAKPSHFLSSLTMLNLRTIEKDSGARSMCESVSDEEVARAIERFCECHRGTLRVNRTCKVYFKSSKRNNFKISKVGTRNGDDSQVLFAPSLSLI